MKKKFHETTLFVVLTLIFFYPVGIYFMFKNKSFNKPARAIIAGIAGFTLVITILAGTGGLDSHDDDDYEDDPITVTDVDTVEEEQEEVVTLTAESIVKNAGGTDVLEVNANDDLVVKMNLSSNLTSSLTLKGAYFEVRKIIEELVANGYTFDTYQFWFTADLIDQYGNTKNSKVLSFEYDRATVDKINFDNITIDNLMNLANNVWTHPALTK